MTTSTRHLLLRRPAALLVAAVVVAGAGTAAAQPDDDELYSPRPNHGAKEQIAELTSSGRRDLADDVRDMIRTPQAVWFTQGTPKTVERDVHRVVTRATAAGEVPLLVAYNIPFRDCAQFSAGGATTVAEYQAWIDGFAAGVRGREAIVILEPDGLGIIPWHTPVDSSTLEWCQPDEADPDTAAAERYEMLEYAVDALGAAGDVAVYLDGTHSGWLNVGDLSDRLLRAGVERAEGFYVNASNYQYTENLTFYGTWVSKCIVLLQGGAASSECANQYWNGGPDGTAIAALVGAWTGVTLDNTGVWSATSDDPTLNTSGIEARYEGVDGEIGFVIDTSRNGQGPWTPGDYPDPQDWCNPPDRGLGLRPTLDTGVELVDAYLWIKIPGESDGECTRGLGDGGSTVDPEWGIVDPAAGAWFDEMVIDLIDNAVPALD